MYTLGLVSISFRTHTVRDILDAVKAAGLSCVEWGSDVHAPCSDWERIAEIAALQKQYGIACCSYGTYFRAGQNTPEEILDYIKAAKGLGTHILRIWCGTKNSEDYTCEEKAALFADCKVIARLAEQEQVKICLECHGDTYTNTLSGALEIMTAVDSPCFRMYWQPNQFADQPTNIAYAEGIAAYTEILHVFNWEGENRYPLEEAIEVWKAYLARFDGNRVLLLEFMPDGDIQTLPREACALQRIVG